MDFLRDPRFSQYRSSTTMKKYFPRNGFEQLSAKDNPIYKLIKSSEPTMHQKNSILKEKQVTRQKAHRTTIQTTNSRFLLHKTTQRLSTINSFFSNPPPSSHSSNSHLLRNHRTQGIRQQILKLNQFTVGVERFQKSINRSKEKVNLLKSYNSKVGSYFQRFEVNEDRTRKEIVEHEEIVRLLLAKNSDDDNVAYFNAVGEKKVKESSGKKSRAKSSGDKIDIQESMVPALVLKEMSKVNGYKGECEERVLNAIDELRKSGLMGIGKVGRVGRDNVSIKESASGSNDGGQMKQSRFFNERRRKSPEDKENHKENSQLNLKQPTPPIIKKGSITRLNQSIFNRQRPSFISSDQTHSTLNQTIHLLKQTNQTFTEQINNNKPCRNFQKRMKTAGPLEYEDERKLIEKKLCFKGG